MGATHLSLLVRERNRRSAEALRQRYNTTQHSQNKSGVTGCKLTTATLGLTDIPLARQAHLHDTAEPKCPPLGACFRAFHVGYRLKNVAQNQWIGERSERLWGRSDLESATSTTHLPGGRPSARHLLACLHRSFSISILSLNSPFACFMLDVIVSAAIKCPYEIGIENER